jgi:hypothetical protein
VSETRERPSATQSQHTIKSAPDKLQGCSVSNGSNVKGFFAFSFLYKIGPD